MLPSCSSGWNRFRLPTRNFAQWRPKIMCIFRHKNKTVKTRTKLKGVVLALILDLNLYRTAVEVNLVEDKPPLIHLNETIVDSLHIYIQRTACTSRLPVYRWTRTWSETCPVRVCNARSDCEFMLPPFQHHRQTKKNFDSVRLLMKRSWWNEVI